MRIGELVVPIQLVNVREHGLHHGDDDGGCLARDEAADEVEQRLPPGLSTKDRTAVQRTSEARAEPLLRLALTKRLHLLDRGKEAVAEALIRRVTLRQVQLVRERPGLVAGLCRGLVLIHCREQVGGESVERVGQRRDLHALPDRPPVGADLGLGQVVAHREVVVGHAQLVGQ